MTEYDLEPMNIDPGLIGLTFTPYGRAFAYDAQNNFISYEFKVDTENRLQLVEEKRITMKKPIIGFFVVPEVNTVIMHCGPSVYLLNAQTFEHKKLSDGVSALAPHHPGYEPVGVPLVQTQGTQSVIDLSFVPIHVSYLGCAKAGFAAVKPFFNGQYALFDFAMVIGNQLTIMYVSSQQVTDVCCSFGQKAFNQVVLDNVANKWPSVDTFQLAFERSASFSSIVISSASIEEAMWVADVLYYRSANSYCALDLRQLSFIQEVHYLQNRQVVQDASQFASIIVQCSEQQNLNNTMQIMGTNASFAKLIQPIIQELNRRLKRGTTIQRYKLPFGSTMNQMEKQARLCLQKQKAEQIATDATCFNFMKTQEQLCYGLLRDQNNILPPDGQPAKQINLLANSGFSKLVEAMCEQLDIQPVQQKIPHCFCLMPVVLSLNLIAELYIVDAERWSRKVEAYEGTKALMNRNLGVEQIECSEDQVVYTVFNQVNIMLEEIKDILYLPKRCDQLAAELAEAIDRGSVQNGQSNYILKTDVYNKLTRKKYSQTLIKKLQEGLTLEKVIQSRQEVNQTLSSTQDRTEQSQIWTAMGLLYFQQKSYMEAASCFLQARSLNPVEIVRIFTHKMAASNICAPVNPDRSEQPDTALIDKCQHFGLYKKHLVSKYSDEHWAKLSQECGNPAVTFQQYCGLQQSLQEQKFCVEPPQSDLGDLLAEQMKQLKSGDQHSILVEDINVLFTSTDDQSSIAKRLQGLAFYLRVYLDVKSNWQPPLRQVLRNCQLLSDKQFVEQFIQPNVSLISNKNNVRSDDQVVFLRTIFALVLCARPFSIKAQEVTVFFQAKPEELYQSSTKRVMALVTNTATTPQQFHDAVGLLTLFRYFHGASKLAEYVRQAETAKADYSFTICLLNTFGVDEQLKEAEWELQKEMEALQLSDPPQKAIFWTFLPYVCLRKPALANEFLKRMITYTVVKTNEQFSQYLFFEKLSLQPSKQLLKYYKAKADDNVKEFYKTFTPEVVTKFLQEIRYTEIDQKATGTEEYLMENYGHHKALVALFLHQVSKCISFAFNDYKMDLYNKKAPSWGGQAARSWLSFEAAEFIKTFVVIYPDNEDAQKSYANSVVEHLEPMLKNYKALIDDLTRKHTTEGSTMQDIDQSNIDQIIKEKEQQAKEDAISEVKTADKKSSEISTLAEREQHQQLSKTLRNRMDAEQLVETKERFQKLYDAFYTPFLISCVKGAQAQKAVTMMLGNCFLESDFEKLWQQSLRKNAKRLATPLTLDLNAFERCIGMCMTLSEPLLKSLYRQSKAESVEQAAQLDSLQFVFNDHERAGTLGVMERSPVKLLCILLQMIIYAYQYNIVERQAAFLAIERMLSHETKCGEELAHYGSTVVVQLLPADYPIKQIIEFVKLGARLRQQSSSELGVGLLQLQQQVNIMRTNIQRVQQEKGGLNKTAVCEVCGKLLTKQGNLVGQYQIVDAGTELAFQHRDCWVGLQKK